MSAAAAIAVLRDAYPRADFPDRSIALYGRMLGDLDDAALTRAVARLIRRKTFLPSIAEIREEVAEEALALPTPEEAWDLVRNAPLGARKSWPPEVDAAAEAVGGRWGIQTTERPETLRAQFRRDYEARRKRAVEVFTGSAATLPPAVDALTLGPTMRSLPETTRIHPRPVMARLSARWAGHALDPPTEEEKADAIAVLRDGSRAPGVLDLAEGADPLYLEAERIFAEGAS